jgi:hypothetical protein
MKKQLLIAAVAATMGTAAIADISITGNAKYEFKNIEDANNATTNTGHTEVNVSIKGTSGDTSVVLNTEWNGQGAVDSDPAGDTASGLLDVEDMYMTTKIGDVSLKMGDFASGTSGLLGEIDNGSRATNKVSASMKIAGASVGYHTTPGSGSGDSVTVSMPVAGYTLNLKESANSYTAYGISGDVSGLGFRLEQQASDTADADVTFGNLTYSSNGIDLGYAWISADDTSDTVKEDDSSIFAVEMAASNSQKTNAVGVKQISAKTSLAGNTVTFKAGTLEHKGTVQDSDFTQIDVKRSLASGATLAATYTVADTENVAQGTAMTDSATLELDISVKF